jgi:L-threonylcarbamoyladenylate synthase
LTLQSQIRNAAIAIQKGELVAFPTETVYGLGANALNANAVSQIFEAKERPSFDPLIVHISNLQSIDTLVHFDALTKEQTQWFYTLAQSFWPGPLTMVVPKTPQVPDIVTSGLPTVGLRMPHHPIALDLIAQAQCPIAAPSANKFGLLSPTCAEHVRKQLPTVLVLDGGATQVGIESTIVSFAQDGFIILRHGVITAQDIAQHIPQSVHTSPQQATVAPGMLQSHYSPQKPLHILSQQLESSVLPRVKAEKATLISFSGKYNEYFNTVVTPSPTGDVKEYAVQLFATLHRLEESDASVLYAEPVPENGIGLAIMDKLRKASFRYKE